MAMQPAKHTPEEPHPAKNSHPVKPGDDPQHAKLEGAPIYPEAWTPEPSLDPRSEKAPANAYADGMTIADEQRARSAWIEAHGEAAYMEAVDDRSDEEKAAKQVKGVVPPTKRS